MRACSLAFALAVVAFTLLPAERAGAQTAFDAATRARIDAAFERAFKRSGAPGAALGIWIPGRGTYVATRGSALRADHVRVGSLTKMFTTTALLQLAGDGKVGLDDPVSRYAPFVPNGRHISLRMLANMTSGLHSYTEDDAWVATSFRNPDRTWKPRELIDVGLRHKPDFAPGTSWHYSNTNTVLLGVIIERVTREPIAATFKRRIFTPLGLRGTVWPSTSAMPAPYARGITRQTVDGAVADATHRNPSWGFTAGQLISTLDDLHAWIVACATGTLVTPRMQRERLHFVTLPPNTPRKAYGIGIGTDSGWLGHSGELPGYNTGAYYLPAQRAAIVVWVNSDIPAHGASPMTGIFSAMTRVLTPANVPR